MVRSLVRLWCGALLSCALAAACGSEDSKKHVVADDGGAAGVATSPTSGGSSSRAGAGPAADAGAGGAPAATSAGAGGELTTAGGAGSNAGESGAAGDNAGASGNAGAPGATAASCCQPAQCPVANLGDECGITIDDGCGNPEKFCDCSPGLTCFEGVCDECVPDVEACADNQDLCGDTFDNCGNPITCPDNCSSQTSGGTCVDGYCCGAKFECDSNDCGLVDNNCGGVLDCSGHSCDGNLCINGYCCSPDEEACSGLDCGYAWDGCEEVLCTNQCTDNQACTENTCADSVCQANGYDCGNVPNSALSDQDEYCGDCTNDQACVDHHCLPICH
jgi:hypothetical protein